jgi:broad-specificity NMP kinase
MTMHDIICLLGNDGCGKSSLCELINSRNDRIVGIERSNGLGVNYGIDPSIVDKLTLEYLFDHENFNKIILPDQTSNQERIYWILLDCQVDTILKRISSRPKKDIWESRKALHYFQQRFRHLGAHFGIPLIDTTHQTLEQVYNEILNLIQNHSNYYQYYRQIGTQILNYDLIQEYDLENKLSKLMNTNDFDQITNLPEYAHEFVDIHQQPLYIRWYINNHSIEINQEKNILQIGDYQLPITGAIFRLITEGESKKIYRDISGNPLTKNLVFIVLKSTIYSHSMQITGEITNLGSIRACGSQIFLEMMWRNDLKHAYRSINSHGIIISDFIDKISPIEIIVKRYCEGTDKNSFYEILDHENIVLPNTNGEYRTGPYVRLDWRNPNHVSPKTKKALNYNPYYYLYERIVGKEEFFHRILTNQQYALPVRKSVSGLCRSVYF